MPKIPVKECPAGPAMDAAVAEALGWQDITYWRDGEISGRHEQTDHQLLEIPHYSTDIAAAEVLWDKLAEDHWVVSVCYGPGRDGRNYASVQMQLDVFLPIDLLTRCPMDMDAKAETKALAICRAFLKANGIEYIEVLE